MINSIDYNWQNQVVNHPLLGKAWFERGMVKGYLIWDKPDYRCWFEFDILVYEEALYGQSGLRTSNLNALHTLLRKGDWICEAKPKKKV